jgi:hypothetical protein
VKRNRLKHLYIEELKGLRQQQIEESEAARA